MNENELDELRGLSQLETTFTVDLDPQFVDGYRAGSEAFRRALRDWLDESELEKNVRCDGPTE